MSSPVRNPMKISSTTITMTTACARLTTKPLIDSVTASDCIEITPNSMPTGTRSMSSFIRTLSASPITTTLPPATVEMPSPMAGLPSNSCSVVGGSL